MPWIVKMLPCVTLMQMWYLWKTQKKLLISHPDSTSQQTGPLTTTTVETPDNTTHFSQMAALYGQTTLSPHS